jgi:hypothetical protein
MDALMESGRAAGRELDMISAEIAAGAFTSVASRLALLLRLDPALAPLIISTADRALGSHALDAPGHAALNLVKGDAYRGLGRELEANEAYREAMRSLPARDGSPGGTGPPGTAPPGTAPPGTAPPGTAPRDTNTRDTNTRNTSTGETNPRDTNNREAP